MKVIDDIAQLILSDINIENLIDIRAKSVEIQCPICKNQVRFFDEAYISRQQEEEINFIISQLNDFIKDINEAVINVYGEDLRFKLFVEKLNKLKVKFTSPRLKVIK